MGFLRVSRRGFYITEMEVSVAWQISKEKNKQLFKIKWEI